MTTLTKMPFKREVRSHCSTPELTAKQLRQLRGVNGSQVSSLHQLFSGNQYPAVFIAHLLLLGVLAGVGYNIIGGDRSLTGTLATYTGEQQSRQSIDRIVSDVVSNHLSHKAMAYQTFSLDELSAKFAYLGFMLSVSNPIERVGAALVGARPCLILNIPAAQLRYQINEHRWITVFQARYQPAIYGDIPSLKDTQAPLVQVEGGVKVSLWQDNGLLFAMAQAD